MMSSSWSSVLSTEPSPARKRLCVVTPHGPHRSLAYAGGAELQIDYLIKALTPLDRYEMHYLARDVESPFRKESYRLVPISSRDRTLRLGYIVDARSLYGALTRIRPDVIYQRVACAYTGVCAHFARRHGARLIWHVAHDSDVERAGSLMAKNPLAQRIEKWSVEYAIARADAIVVQTAQQAASLRRNYGRVADAVIPNFHPEPEEKVDKSGPRTVVWVGNLKPWKQPEVFVRLANALSDLPGVRFVMIGAPAAGPGNRRWRAALTDAINAARNLEYLGRMAQPEINEWLARAHLYVNTSIQEGFPNTFIQSWMREVPVVSFVNPDNVLSRKGVGIPVRCERDLVAAVRLLLTDSQARAAHGERARKYAVQTHSLRNALSLEKLLDGGGAARGADRRNASAKAGPHAVGEH